MKVGVSACASKVKVQAFVQHSAIIFRLSVWNAFTALVHDRWNWVISNLKVWHCNLSCISYCNLSCNGYDVSLLWYDVTFIWRNYFLLFKRKPIYMLSLINWMIQTIIWLTKFVSCPYGEILCHEKIRFLKESFGDLFFPGNQLFSQNLAVLINK